MAGDIPHVTQAHQYGLAPAQDLVRRQKAHD